MKNSSKFMVFSLLLAGFAGVASANFSDVQSTSVYFDAVNYLQANNIAQGYSDGTFGPGNSINRAEFVKILLSASQGLEGMGKYDSCMDQYVNSNGTYKNIFTDVPIQPANMPWYTKYVCYAKQINFISGYSDGSFKPNNNVTFAEAAKMVLVALGYAPRPSSTGPWYEPYVLVLSEHNAIPTAITTFSHELTRGEMAEIIYRLKANITNKTSETYDQLNQNSNPPQSSVSIEQLPHSAGQAVYASCQNGATGGQMYAWFMMGIDTGSYGYYDQNGNQIGSYSYMVPRGSMGGQKIATTDCTAMTQQAFAAAIKDQTTLPQ